MLKERDISLSLFLVLVGLLPPSLSRKSQLEVLYGVVRSKCRGIKGEFMILIQIQGLMVIKLG